LFVAGYIIIISVDAMKS